MALGVAFFFLKAYILLLAIRLFSRRFWEKKRIRWGGFIPVRQEVRIQQWRRGLCYTIGQSGGICIQRWDLERRWRMEHRGWRELAPIWWSQLWVSLATLRERWLSRVRRRRHCWIRVRTHSCKRRRNADHWCASDSSSRKRIGRCCRRRGKITVARSPEGTGWIGPGRHAMDHTIWTNEQGEDNLWIRSKADI